MQAKGKLAVVVVVAALGLAASGTASASTHAAAARAVPTCTGNGTGVNADLLSAAATYLGSTTDAVRTALSGGSSLADLATKAGKTVAGLESALRTAYKAKLDAKVTAGTLTAAQEQTLLASFDAKVASLVNKTGTSALRSFGHRR
jgi:hypothetical protein